MPSMTRLTRKPAATPCGCKTSSGKASRNMLHGLGGTSGGEPCNRRPQPPRQSWQIDLGSETLVDHADCDGGENTNDHADPHRLIWLGDVCHVQHESLHHHTEHGID